MEFTNVELAGDTELVALVEKAEVGWPSRAMRRRVPPQPRRARQAEREMCANGLHLGCGELHGCSELGSLRSDRDGRRRPRRARDEHVRRPPRPATMSCAGGAERG
jgi:hypothetical protein